MRPSSASFCLIGIGVGPRLNCRIATHRSPRPEKTKRMLFAVCLPRCVCDLENRSCALGKEQLGTPKRTALPAGYRNSAHPPGPPRSKIRDPTKFVAVSNRARFAPAQSYGNNSRWPRFRVPRRRPLGIAPRSKHFRTATLYVGTQPAPTRDRPVVKTFPHSHALRWNPAGTHSGSPRDQSSSAQPRFTLELRRHLRGVVPRWKS